MLLIALALAGTAAVDDCGDKQTQTAMTMCEKAVADRADAEMREPFAANQCLAAVTTARTQQLRELLWDR
ncbi:hypothetical protein ACBY01_03050 [Sphingomonas sp. ac-8]|uniref:hypothetical protein n=1 Tax=Sphingomonas sp. ac-8 TaxID=3242977 RepID=UPI003A7F9936